MTEAAHKSKANEEQLKVILHQSLLCLRGKNVDSSRIDELVTLVRVSMSTPTRIYHSLSHALDVAKDMQCECHAIAILSSCFHDIIYLTVDSCILPVQEPYIVDIVHTEPRPNRASGSDEAEDSTVTTVLVICLPPRTEWDEAITMVDWIFDGLKTQQPGANSNEYLSAIVAVRALRQTLSTKNLIALVACIEASIPFRRKRPDGTTPMQALYLRLKAAYHNDLESGGSLYLSEQELTEMVQQAAFFANCDMKSFRSTDFSRFLDLSWSLLPEWFPPLIAEKTLLQDKYNAVKLLLSRYPNMPIETLFQSFNNVPSEETISSWNSRAAFNLKAAAEYASIRCLEIMSVIGALQIAFREEEKGAGVLNAKIAAMGGGNAFWRRFHSCVMETLNSTCWDDRVDDEVSRVCLNETCHVVRQVLKKGRDTGYEWDAAEAPWALFLCTEWGYDSVLSHSQKMLADSDIRGGEEKCIKDIPRHLLDQLIVILQEVMPDDAAAMDKIRVQIA